MRPFFTESFSTRIAKEAFLRIGLFHAKQANTEGQSFYSNAEIPMITQEKIPISVQNFQVVFQY